METTGEIIWQLMHLFVINFLALMFNWRCNKTANNLSDLADKSHTSRTNLGVAIGTNVQAFISATAGTNANGTRTVSTSSSEWRIKWRYLVSI